ncbi:MAG: amidohydrolase family protein [Novosphingobium sp.]|nr:amidohydrolase family protein [Novosphingobium sp.]
MPAYLIKGGTIADGNGGEPYRGDVRILGDRIAQVGADLQPEPDDQVIDAAGLLVTPGFVDLHTHYDGQITWDSDLTPSSWHGVTTLIVGNCGVGFAPVRPGQQDRLIELMEGVEDIPGTALHEGITWGWESFGDYLDVLDQRRWTVDVGTQVPHAAVRAYVMGEEAGAGQATAEQIAQMRNIVREGLEAGALGISTTRMIAHRSIKQEVVPGTFAPEDELMALADLLAERGEGVFEVVPRGMDGEVSREAHAEFDWMERVATRTGRPVLFSLVQTHTEPERWRLFLDRSKDALERGVPIRPVVSCRPTGVVFGLQSTFTPFSTRAAYKALEHLPLAERVAEMKRPEVRTAILAEPNGRYRSEALQYQHEHFANMFKLCEPFEWEPDTSQTMLALAEAAGQNVEAYVYDYMLENGGRNLILFPYTNYCDFTMDTVHDMLSHSSSVFGLSDGGAHCGIACDAGNTTLALSFWTRDRTKGPKLALGRVVKMMSRDTAEMYGLKDRGRIEPGLRADINLIDYDNLAMALPEMVWDLPTGARRVVQRARGYVATFVAGVQTIDHDQLTGALPGRLIRGQVVPEEQAPLSVTV